MTMARRLQALQIAMLPTIFAVTALADGWKPTIALAPGTGQKGLKP